MPNTEFTPLFSPADWASAGPARSTHPNAITKRFMIVPRLTVLPVRPRAVAVTAVNNFVGEEFLAAAIHCADRMQRRRPHTRSVVPRERVALPRNIAPQWLLTVEYTSGEGLMPKQQHRHEKSNPGSADNTGSDRGIVRNALGEEQPRDKERALRCAGRQRQ
jgi:hypothetical protein